MIYHHTQGKSKLSPTSTEILKVRCDKAEKAVKRRLKDKLMSVEIHKDLHQDLSQLIEDHNEFPEKRLIWD